MEDEYLLIKYDHANNSWKHDAVKNGTLISIEYNMCIIYGIFVSPDGIAYHNLNGPAIKYKSGQYWDQYFIYGEFIDYANQMTFEEFKIKRDRLLKEMVFS